MNGAGFKHMLIRRGVFFAVCLVLVIISPGIHGLANHFWTDGMGLGISKGLWFILNITTFRTALSFAAAFLVLGFLHAASFAQVKLSRGFIKFSTAALVVFSILLLYLVLGGIRFSYFPPMPLKWYIFVIENPWLIYICAGVTAVFTDIVVTNRRLRRQETAG